MSEPLPERCVFRARYTVAWPIWAGGYPTQGSALSTLDEHASELTAQMRAHLLSSFGDQFDKQFETKLSWQANDYQPIPGLSPRSSVPNSVELTVTVLAVSPAPVGT